MGMKLLSVELTYTYCLLFLSLSYGIHASDIHYMPEEVLEQWNRPPIPRQSLRLPNPSSMKSPLMRGADPFVTYIDGFYHVLITRQFDIAIYVVEDLNDVDFVEPTIVWCIDIANLQTDIWAPELHKYNDKWIIISTGRRTHASPYEMFILESTTDSQLGHYEFKGFLNLKDAIDGSLLTIAPPDLNGNSDNSTFIHQHYYLIWSQFVWEAGSPLPPEQCIYIGPMTSINTIGEPRVKLACAEYEWEKYGNRINEGPMALMSDTGQLYIIYSASGSWTHKYKLGMLTFQGDIHNKSSVLNSTAWVKHPEPVFQSRPEVGIYGPGHHAITKVGSGKWMMVYHVKNTQYDTFDDREIHAKWIGWHPDGSPDLGSPPQRRYTVGGLHKLRQGSACPAVDGNAVDTNKDSSTFSSDNTTTPNQLPLR